MVKIKSPTKPASMASVNHMRGGFSTTPTLRAASSAAASIFDATASRSSPLPSTTSVSTTLPVGGKCVSEFLLMTEFGMTAVSPLAFVMVVWRQLTSFTTPFEPPMEMLSPGVTIRSKLTCTPPIRLEMVS